MKSKTPGLQRPTLKRVVAAALAATLAIQPHMAAQAANHPLTAVRDVNIIDYVVNVDWDYDNPPTQQDNPGQLLDRAYITQVIRTVARSKFTATEGRHRLGNVFIYKNGQFGNNVDIRMINKSDRSAANISGWGTRGQTSYNYLAYSGAFESVDALGKVINHELGHYTYGLYDEYVEAGAALKPSDPGSPSGEDTPKNTAMNNHLEFVSLSTPADYANAAERKTAQARMMATQSDGTGGSAWEMLTRPPEQDPEVARGQGRTFFEAFRGIDPKTLNLTRPTTGFDADLKLIFAPAPVFRDVIVVDRTLPAARLADLIQAAKTLITQAGADAQFAIVASPATGNEPVATFTTADAAGKQTLTAALDAIQADTAGTFNALTAFTKAYELIGAARQAGDPATLHLLTGSEAQVPAEAASTAKAARIAVSPLGLTGASAEARAMRAKTAVLQSKAGASVNLTQLAQFTGGAYNSARNGAEAAKDVTRALNEVHAKAIASVRLDGSDALAANGSFSTQFRIASASLDGTVDVESYFDPADAKKLSFSLTAPDGRVFTPANAPAGIDMELDAAEGVFIATIGTEVTGRNGVWTLKATSNAAMVDGLSVDVSSASRLALNGEVTGGVLAAVNTAPTLRATLASDKRIKGATVRATVYNEDGQAVLENLVMRDDGVAPDLRAGDGEYAVSLKDKLKAGEYYAIVEASNDGSAVIASLGALVKGARAEETPVEAFQREAELSFTLESTATGVLGTDTTPTPTPTPTPGSGDSGGGCTVNPDGRDASLLALLGLALAGAALRRRLRLRKADRG